MHVRLDPHGHLPGELFDSEGPVLRDAIYLPQVPAVVTEVESLEIAEVDQGSDMHRKLFVGALEELAKLGPREDAPSSSPHGKSVDFREDAS